MTETSCHRRLNEIEHGLDRFDREQAAGFEAERRQRWEERIHDIRERLAQTRDLFHEGLIGDDGRASSPIDDLEASYLLAIEEFSSAEAPLQGKSNLPHDAKSESRPAMPSQPKEPPPL